MCSYYKCLDEASEPVALFRLGIMNELGQGVVRDIKRAHAYYWRGTKAGHILSRRNLGYLEIKRGDIIFGIPLVLSAMVEGVFRTVFTPTSVKMG